MDFQKYINHNTFRSIENQKSVKKGTQQKPRVIKFVGDMEENIKQLLQGINCHCGNKKQFHNILIVFANKIQKLRTQREHYKNTLKQYLISMNANNSKKTLEHALDTKEKQQKKKRDASKKEIKNMSQTVQTTSQNKQNLTPLSKLATMFPKQKQKALYTEESLPKQISKVHQQAKNSYTAIKKPLNADEIFQSKTDDKRMSNFYQIQKMVKEFAQDTCKNDANDNNDGSFSLNLSEFQDVKGNRTSEFMKEVSSIMSETNLLESDEEDNLCGTDKKDSFTLEISQSKLRDSQQKANKLKMIKQSVNLETILTSITNDEDQKSSPVNFMLTQKKLNRKLQNPEQSIKVNKKGASLKKSSPFSKQNDKENIKAESCMKKCNVSIEKLEQFIQNKEGLRQLPKPQQFDFNLRNFKSISSCTLKKENLVQLDSMKPKARPMRALEQRKIHFNF